MTIPIKSLLQFSQDMQATWGQGIGVTPVLSPGDFLLALFEAVSGQLDFLQAQAVLILALTRAQTSTGPDLDSFFADFDFSRLPATFAIGPVVLGIPLPAAAPIFVQAASVVNGVTTGGVLVQTVGGAQVFQVVADTSQPAYQSQSNTYALPAGATSMNVTVQATVAGTVGNVAAGAITQLASQQASISTVNNVVPISNGSDAESDAAYRARFVLFFSTLARGTKAALLAAAEGVQQGLQVVLAENQMPNGQTLNGSFTCFVDDGTGSPPASLLAAVFAAEDATRAFSVQPFVAAPNILTAAVALAVRLAPGSLLSAVQPLVQSAIAGVAESLVAGATLFVSAVEQAALGVAGVEAIRPGTTINSQAQDLVPGSNVEVRVVTTGVTVGAY